MISEYVLAIADHLGPSSFTHVIMALMDYRSVELQEKVDTWKVQYMIAQVTRRISFRSFSKEGSQNLPPPCEINMDSSHKGVQAYLAYWMQGVLEKCMASPNKTHFRHGRCRKQLVSTTCLFCAHFLESMVFQSWTVMDS